MNSKYFTKKIKLSTYFFILKRNCYIQKAEFPFPKKKITQNLQYFSIQEINKLPLNDSILYLPKDIRNKIYVFWIKRYYKEQLLHKSLKPMWYEHNILVQKQLLKSKLYNVHFLHLDFNTLPENKEYILGCQCSFCKNYLRNNQDEVIYKVLHQINNIEFFNKTVPFTETIWNSQLYPVINNNNILFFNYVFNPLYDVLC